MIRLNLWMVSRTCHPSFTADRISRSPSPYRIISELADNGVGILLISSEMPEILHLSDRILVMHEGNVTAELSREEATQESIMHAAVAGAEVRAEANGG